MRLTSEIYRKAAGENLECAEILHEHGKYAGAHYLAGVAVECMLRAYRLREEPEFDGRHDLVELYRASKLEKRIPAARVTECRDAILEIGRRWNNNQRYMSADGARAALRRSGLHQGIRGDYLKASARRMLLLARLLVRLGEENWARPWRRESESF